MIPRDRQPVGRDYHLMVGALAEVARRRDAELAHAERAYQDSASAAAGELARAEGEAAEAERRAAAAAAAVLDVDREAARLWEQLSRARRVRALGALPEPAPVEALPRVALTHGPDGAAAGARRPESARTLLLRTAARIDRSMRPAPRRPLPGWALAVLPLLGAAVSALVGLLAAGLVTAGEAGAPGGALLRGLGWLAFLVAPSAGVPAAAYLAHRHLTARLDIGGIGLTLLGGMVAATALSVTFANR